MNDAVIQEAIIIPFPREIAMAKFRGSVLSCAECGGEFRVPPSRAGTARYCSLRCADQNRSTMQDHRKKRVVMKCAKCEKPFEAHGCHAHRRKYCTKACRNAAWSSRSKGHRKQVANGLRVGITQHTDGYLLVWSPDHPFSGSSGYVMEHRLVMERWLRSYEPSSSFLIKLGTKSYLSPDFEVHHKDEVKTNNSIDNLECMTPSQHAALHNKQRAYG